MSLADDAATIQAALKDLVTLLIQELHRMWRLIQGRRLDAVQTRDLLVAASPDLVNPYASAAAKLTATWYDQLVPDSSYRAVTAPLPPEAELAASVRWAVTPLFGPTEAATTDVPLERLAGSMQRRVFDASRDTVALNVEAEPETRYVRYASATACAFCRMLSLRTQGYYLSEHSARYVVGRKRGADVYPRGTQAIGEKYHDHCKCIAVAIRAGDTWKPPDYVNRWSQEFEDAKKKASGGSIQDLMREMRKYDTN
jgi:hypothetical protein